MAGAWHVLELVRFDLGGQKCAASPTFPSVQAWAATDVLLVGIKEGQAKIDPRGVLDCTVLLEHGRLLALPVSERATCGVQQLRQFMASHQDELRAVRVNCGHAFVECAGLKAHMVQHFANVQMSKMWEAVALEKAHALWVNVWCIHALLRTYCPAKAALQRAISFRGRFSSTQGDHQDQPRPNQGKYIVLNDRDINNLLCSGTPHNKVRGPFHCKSHHPLRPPIVARNP